MAPLRIYLTLSGGASLGAYEAGAASAVCLAVRRLESEEDVEASIDAVGGASAGAIVGLLASYAITEGLDPVDLLHEAWVERVSLRLLRGTDSSAPLTFHKLRERIPDLLDFVLASAASPGGFAPEVLDRRPDAEAYRRRGIQDFPKSGHLWYTDGGMLGSQPLGRVIAAGEALHGSEDGAFRLQLLVNPRSEVPAG